MFEKRLKEIVRVLDTTPSDIARQMKCDRSYIHRLLSGDRIPKKQGPGAKKLAKGLYTFADDKDKTGVLCSLVSCENAVSAEEIYDAILKFLYDGEPDGKVSKSFTPKETVPYRTFGDRLNAVMELTDCSNVRLGRSLSLDPSYISRFRNGLRSPKSNPKTMNAVASVLLDRVYDQKKVSTLAKMMGVPLSDMSERDEALEIFNRWLYNIQSDDNAPLIEGLIDQIGSFSAEINKPTLSFEEATAGNVLSDDSANYYGMDGLRCAVIRFLTSVILKKPEAIFLYSDQNINWMVSDPSFHAKWAALMVMCVNGGTQIHIIHNVNRDISEMTAAIQSWLPLYPSGMIKSYYCKTRGSTRFSTTLFLCPGIACISGVNVIGTEDRSGLYRYDDTDETVLLAQKEAYQGLLEQSGEMVHAYKTSDIGLLEEKNISSTAMIGNTLSLATMPENTLISALDRSGADTETKERLLAVRKERAELLKRITEKGLYHEYMPIPSDERLFADGVTMDLPELSLSYTPNEYAEHIRGIISTMEANTNYRFFVLPESPFEDVNLLISDSSVAVSRLKAPYITIFLEHPDLCHAFVAYAERIREQYKQDKLTTKKMLERYL